MISDVLADAIAQTKNYLTDETFADVYSEPELNRKILALLEQMETLRQELDTPPDVLERQRKEQTAYNMSFTMTGENAGMLGKFEYLSENLGHFVAFYPDNSKQVIKVCQLENDDQAVWMAEDLNEWTDTM